MSDFAAKRWEKKTSPNEHEPREALEACLRDIDSGKLDPKHIIVVYCKKPENNEEDGATGFYQSGKMDGYFGSLGMLTRALQIMGDD